MTHSRTRTRYRGVQLLSDGRYLITTRYVDPRSGQRRLAERTIAAGSPAEAAVAQQALRAALIEGLGTQRMRLSAYAESWLTRKRRELAPSTLDRYGRTVLEHILPSLGALYLDALRPADIVRWRDDIARRLAPVTTNGHLRVLRTMLADASAELQIANPAARVKQIAEAPSHERKALSADELHGVMLAMRDLDHEVYTCLVLLALTGMRWSEASALHWSDVGDTEIRIRRSQWRGKERSVTKTKRERAVPVPAELGALLRAHRSSSLRERTVTSPLVFATSAGGPRSRTWASKALDRAIASAGVHRVSLHGLRHTLNNLLRAVASSDVQKAITGHASEAMRLHYTHVAADEKRAAVARVIDLVRR